MRCHVYNSGGQFSINSLSLRLTEEEAKEMERLNGMVEDDPLSEEKRRE